MLDEARKLLASCPDPGVLSARLVEVARTLTPAHRRIEGDSDLTERELEVLRYLAEGLSKREIGKELFLSFNTIHSHTKSIYQKLRVSSRQDAIARAQDSEPCKTAQRLADAAAPSASLRQDHLRNVSASYVHPGEPARQVGNSCAVAPRIAGAEPGARRERMVPPKAAAPST